MTQRCQIAVLVTLAVVGVSACTTGRSRTGDDTVDATQRAELQGLTRIDAQAAALGGTVRQDLERVRIATASYRDLAAAKAAGFPTADPPCLDSLPVGTMGHHYVDRRIVDDKVDVEHPEILLYAPQSSGPPKLVAVEYIIPFRIRPPEETPPRIFGQDMKRQEALKLWYLHVWAWEENPAGLFADWNPKVRCG